MTDTAFVASVVALLGEDGGAWSGTAGDLLALLAGVAGSDLADVIMYHFTRP